MAAFLCALAPSMATVTPEPATAYLLMAGLLLFTVHDAEY